MQENNKEIALSYLNKYQNKDLMGIEEMFDKDITLRDWKITVIGKEKAIIETKKNFDSVNSINIEVFEIYENKNSVAAELKITIDYNEEFCAVGAVVKQSK